MSTTDRNNIQNTQRIKRGRRNVYVYIDFLREKWRAFKQYSIALAVLCTQNFELRQLSVVCYAVYVYGVGVRANIKRHFSKYWCHTGYRSLAGRVTDAAAAVGDAISIIYKRTHIAHRPYIYYSTNTKCHCVYLLTSGMCVCVSLHCTVRRSEFHFYIVFDSHIIFYSKCFAVFSFSALFGIRCWFCFFFSFHRTMEYADICKFDCRIAIARIYNFYSAIRSSHTCQINAFVD